MNRKYPEGRMGPEDEGQIALKVGINVRYKRIVMDFGKPVEWIGFGPERALALAASLIGKAEEVMAMEKEAVEGGKIVEKGKADWDFECAKCGRRGSLIEFTKGEEMQCPNCGGIDITMLAGQDGEG